MNTSHLSGTFCIIYFKNSIICVSSSFNICTFSVATKTSIPFRLSPFPNFPLWWVIITDTTHTQSINTHTNTHSLATAAIQIQFCLMKCTTKCENLTFLWFSSINKYKEVWQKDELGSTKRKTRKRNYRLRRLRPNAEQQRHRRRVDILLIIKLKITHGTQWIVRWRTLLLIFRICCFCTRLIWVRWDGNIYVH